MNPLHRLAERAGVQRHWHDIEGHENVVADATLAHLLDALGYPAANPGDIESSMQALAAAERAPPTLVVGDAGGEFDVTWSPAGARWALRDGSDACVAEGAHGDRVRAPATPGYYVLETGGHRCAVAVAPVSPPKSPHAFALAAQVYSLRRRHGGGLGDFEALAQLAERAADRGADALAISPVHALPWRTPGHGSPYSPSSRKHYNILHADPASALGDRELASLLAELGLAQAWERSEQAALIDWPAVGAMRQRVLRAVHAQARASGGRMRAEFERWRADAGTALHLHACFEAIDALHPPGEWPAHLLRPTSEALRAFAAAHADEVEFHAFAQWLAARGLDRAQARARAAGMRIGLVADLAVGVDPRGSDVWCAPAQMLHGVGVGAPRDLLAPQGQNWGLTTFSPSALRATGYAGFLDCVRAALAHAGGARIDHVIGLQRLWLVPDGAHASDGAYVAYPREDLLRLLALEAHLRGRVLIGEDLGTVPDGFRERLARHAILGIGVLMFERDGDAFRPAAAWRRDAIATTATHDLPTLAGWWLGREIEWRHRLGLISDADLAWQAGVRRYERARLCACIGAENGAPRADDDSPDAREAFVSAAVAHVARTPAPLAVVPVEDIVGEIEQPNLPGTTTGHPNWRRRLPHEVERLLDEPRAAERLAALSQLRPRGAGA